MTNETQKNEKQPEQKQPTAQVELSDEQLEQVTGGGIKVPDSPVTAFPPGPGIIAPDV